MTEDVETAKRFYGELFGWEYLSDPANDFFTGILLAGRPIAGVIGRFPWNGPDERVVEGVSGRASLHRLASG